MDNDFRLYLPEEYASQQGLPFKTKTELAGGLLEERLSLHAGIPRDRIVLLTDATYATGKSLGSARENGLIYLAG
jgi:hypothetical protein